MPVSLRSKTMSSKNEPRRATATVRIGVFDPHRQVDWSPDGRFILFTSHRDYPDNYTDVYVMRPDGSDVRRLTHQRAYTPAWSPDGEHIVFSAPGLFVMSPDGTGVSDPGSALV
jgi:Tol biopolymer transport system component